MGTVTQFTGNEVEECLKELLKDARQGKITYIKFLIQREDEDFVEWDLCYTGEKSYDVQHLMAEIGYLYLATQEIFIEIQEMADAD